VRDYIHIVDLSRGHLKALEKLRNKPGLVTLNLGTGRGYSVLEAIAAFTKACGKPIPYRIVARRPGKGLTEMCADAWRWQVKNPSGYPDR
ncbi:MAG: UDP-glucose 4-epimerase GalE, partial [Deltaproteobacteria bacterium]|nr:UDP-glucose 4-epimerase GalE [Deltaproteobacteria bacterium]